MSTLKSMKDLADEIRPREPYDRRRHIIYMGEKLYAAFCRQVLLDEELPEGTNVKNPKYNGYTVKENTCLSPAGWSIK